MSSNQTYQHEDRIRQYLQDRMNDQERQAFEREMQRDPFLAEAVEGYSDSSTEFVFTDLAELQQRISKRQKDNRRYIWYAAASVLVLLVSTFILFNLEEKSSPMVSEIKIQQETSPKIEIEPEKREPVKTKLIDMGKFLSDSKTKFAEEQKVINTEVENTLVADTKTESAFSSSLSGQLKKSFQTTENLKFAKVSKAAPDTLAMVSVNDDSAKGQVFFSEVSVPRDQVVTIAASKVQPVAEKAEQMMMVSEQEEVEKQETVGEIIEKKDTASASNAVASPIGGWEAFNKYLDSKTQIPTIGSSDEKIVVRLSLVVTESGSIEEFKILSGKNEKYNQEAIRIVKDGPTWNPEIKNRNSQRSVVKLRIVFRPSGK